MAGDAGRIRAISIGEATTSVLYTRESGLNNLKQLEAGYLERSDLPFLAETHCTSASTIRPPPQYRALREATETPTFLPSSPCGHCHGDLSLQNECAFLLPGLNHPKLPHGSTVNLPREVASILGDGNHLEGVPVVRHQELVTAVCKRSGNHHLPVLDSGCPDTHSGTPVVANVAPSGHVLKGPVVVLLATEPRIMFRLCHLLAGTVERLEEQLAILHRDRAAARLLSDYIRLARPRVGFLPWLRQSLIVLLEK